MNGRSFIPGSMWLYFKIYTGHKAADTILSSTIRKLVAQLKSEGAIEDFFFIRYTDPKFHIRLRFLMPDTAAYSPIFGNFYGAMAPLHDSGIINTVQCDTYEREMERYGTDSIETVERFFGVDSFFIIELLDAVYGAPADRDMDRWVLSLNLIDDLLDSFGYALETKTEIMSHMAESYKKEFGFTQKSFSKQLNDKYRALKGKIPRGLTPPDRYPGLLAERKAGLEPFAATLLSMEKAGTLELPLRNIVTSLIHMTMNRWFPSRNRLYELVIYDFLLRSYRAEKALAGKG